MCLSSVLPCTQVAYACTGLVYINCVCACVYQSDSLPTQQQRGVTEGLPLRWQTVWSSKLCLFSLTGCQSASVFFTPLHSPYLHPSLPFFIPFQWNEKGRALVSMRNSRIIVSMSCLSSQSIGLRPLLSDCHHGAMMRCENLARFVEGGKKAWQPTDLTPLSSWYQSPRT